MAIKMLDLEADASDAMTAIEKEIKFLVECNDHHITRFYESFIHGSKLFIVMEFIGGGSVRDILGRWGKLPEVYIAIIMRELLLGL